MKKYNESLVVRGAELKPPATSPQQHEFDLEILNRVGQLAKELFLT